MYICYTIRCIITINISLTRENVFLLYETMYNDNKYFIIHENVFLLYKTMYNDNIYLL